MSHLNDFKGTHDMTLDFEAENVIYLYRNPIDCIFSNLKYDQTTIDNIELIDKYLNIWNKHIQKWVFDEKFTKRKVILSYENLKKDFVKEFSKLLVYLNLEVDEKRIILAKETYTKNKIREIVHDKKVINNETDYELQRERFVDLFGKYIFDKLPLTHKDICIFPEKIFG
jgi:hypothetical protein